MTRVVVACALIVSVGHVALASDQVVNNCSTDTELQSDMAALQASGGGTLTFACGPASIVLTGGTLYTFSADAVVDGGDAVTLSGNNVTQLFTVSAGRSLTLKNITLTLGYSSSDGGCIYSAGVLILNHAILDQCRAGNDGGGIFSGTGGVVVVFNNSVISYNTANRDCGGICEFGVSLLVDHSTVDHNTSATRYAGGIGGVNLMVIRNSTISNNTAFSDGGGIFNNDGAFVEDSVVTGNSSSQGWGGAIVNDGGSLQIVASILTANHAPQGGAIANRAGPNTPSIDLLAVALGGNTAVEGGAIYNLDGNAVVRDSTFSGNQARFGGGVENRAGMTLTNVTFSGNSAGESGGIENISGTISLVHVTLTGNSGGGFSHYGVNPSQTFSVVDTLVAGNSSVNCVVWSNSQVSITSNGFNLSTDGSCAAFFNLPSDWNNANANLGGLRNNGGPTATHKVFPPSNAIDHGACLGGVATDQRGMPRPLGGWCDIGAVEYDPFADDPLVAGVTGVKAVHVTELRGRIDALRARHGRPAFTWTDPALSPTVSPIRAQHVVELRMALGDAYTGAGLTPPTYTDPGLAAGMAVKAIYVQELRAAVLALDQQ